jgi:hypothetical protein
MKGIRKINTNPAEQRVESFMAAANAVAEQNRQRGEKYEFISASNARETFKKLIKTSMALANPANPNHAAAHNALLNEFDHNRGALDQVYDIGLSYLRDTRKLAASAQNAGMTPEAAVEFAMNSLAGNPVFDHFGNLNLLAGQLYEQQTFVESFLDSGDAFAVPTEGGTGLDKSRFRAPVEQVTGSAKRMQGDINPQSNLQDDTNRTQISLYNEFKDAITLETTFSITQAMRDQALGYEKAVSPALAGFILQNRYFGASIKQVMKHAELNFAFGLDATANYVPNVGGTYGLISPSIQLQLASWDSAQPLVATSVDWAQNPTKLIQKIKNFYYKPASTSGPLDIAVDPSLMYKDIVRLFNLPAQQNVDFTPQAWKLYVPTSWYALAVQYPGTQTQAGQGTFNKQLNEMVKTATGGKIIGNIEILPSSLLNFGASNGFTGSNSYNYMVLIAQGCQQENKPVIMPGQTAVPTVVSENVSAQIMNFRTQYLFGGPMVMHYGGAFIMEFSEAAGG